MQVSTTLPDALMDRVVYGFTGVKKGGGKETLERFLASLGEISTVSTPQTRKAPGYVQITLHLVTDADQPAGEARVDLHLKVVGNDVIFGNRCAIHMNGMVLLRGMIGSRDPGMVSLNGKLNVLGSDQLASEQVEQQLESLGEALEYVSAALSAAFGEEWRPNGLWLKVGEACRDYVSDDAISDMRIIQHATMCGTLDRRWDLYRRVSAEDHDGVPTLRFISHAGGPEDKIYPKRKETRRLEVACSDRRKVVKLTKERRDEFTADGLRRLTRDFLSQASCRLDRLEQHVDEVLSGAAPIESLLIGLKVLIDRAAGVQKRKGPRSANATALAQDALAGFLSIGSFDASGIHQREAIRRDLDGLCGPDGLLDKHPRRAVYYLKPKYARACGLIRSSEAV